MAKILINLTLYKPAKAPGFELYVKALLLGLASVEQTNYKYYILCPLACSSSLKHYSPSFTFIQILPPGKISSLLQELFLLPFFSLLFDLIIHPHNFLPILPIRKNLLVVHDLKFLTNARDFSLLQLLYRKLFSRRSIILASSVISISHQTRDEVWKYAAIHSHTIYNGLPEASPSLSTSDSTSLLTLDSSKPFILCICSEDTPNKNLLPSIHAALQYLTTKSDLSFVFIGKWESAHFQPLDRHPQVHLLGYVSEAYKCRLMETCSAVLVPSLYEGFGYPYIESLTYGKPIICTNNPAARELLEDLPVYIRESYDSDSIFISLIEFSNRQQQLCSANFSNYLRSHSKKFSVINMGLEYTNIISTLVTSSND